MLINCFSIFPCSDKSDEESVKNAYLVRNSLKKSRTAILDMYKERILKQTELITFIEEAILVPAPRSIPMKKGFAWPALEICKKLREYGFADGIAELLQRDVAVPKAAFQKSEDRPKVKDHIKSMSIKKGVGVIGVNKIIVVDDVVTQGTMLASCVLLLEKEFPDAKISTLAIVRSSKFYDFKNEFEPKRLEITYFDSGATFCEHNPIDIWNSLKGG